MPQSAIFCLRSHWRTWRHCMTRDVVDVSYETDQGDDGLTLVSSVGGSLRGDLDHVGGLDEQANDG